MYMTKKEKKAILEAMQQIRNNQRLIEQQLGLYDMSRGFGPRTDRMPGELGAPGSRRLDRQIQQVDYAMMPPVEDIIGRSRDPQQPSQEELPLTVFGSAETLPKRTVYTVKGINPDGSLSTQSVTGTGRSVKSKRAGMKDARRMMRNEQTASGRTSQLGMRLANRRVPGLTARGQRTPSTDDGSRFNSQTGRFDIQGPKKVPFNSLIGDRSNNKSPFRK